MCQTVENELARQVVEIYRDSIPKLPPLPGTPPLPSAAQVWDDLWGFNRTFEEIENEQGRSKALSRILDMWNEAQSLAVRPENELWERIRHQIGGLAARYDPSCPGFSIDDLVYSFAVFPQDLVAN